MQNPYISRQASPKVLNLGVLWTKFNKLMFDVNQEILQKPTIYMGTKENIQKNLNHGFTPITGVTFFHQRILAYKNVKPQVLGWSHGLKFIFVA